MCSARRAGNAQRLPAPVEIIVTRLIQVMEEITLAARPKHGAAGLANAGTAMFRTRTAIVVRAAAGISVEIRMASRAYGATLQTLKSDGTSVIHCQVVWSFSSLLTQKILTHAGLY